MTALARLAAIGGSNRLILAEALVAVALASLAIRLVPFRKVVAAAARGRVAGPPPGARRTVLQCRWAVRAWGARVPWRAVCFQQGLALHVMLRRRGIASVLHYGVASGTAKGLAAHVWVTVDGEVVLGGGVPDDFARLASFPAEEAAGAPATLKAALRGRA